MSGVLQDSTFWWTLCLTGAAAIAATAYVLFGPESLRGRDTRVPGLVNLGNTCFINSVLQALASSPSLLQWLDNKDGLLAVSLNRVLHALNDNKESVTISPEELLRALTKHRWLIDYQQQDALEFYHVLLTTLDEEMTTGPTSSLSDLINDCQLVTKNSSTRGMALTKIGSFSAPSQPKPCPLRGLMSSSLVCCECQHSLPTRYEFIDSISLPLSRGTTSSQLLQCLQDYMSSELVDDIECPSCSRKSGVRTKRTFKKQLRLGRPPEILCLNIIRSVWRSDGFLSKNTARLHFPFSLDISRFLTAPASRDKIYNRDYKLKAVVEHLGGPSSGHYCTYRQCGRQWVYTSDTTVYPVHSSEVSNCEAYLLFYQQTA